MGKLLKKTVLKTMQRHVEAMNPLHAS